MKYSIVFVLSMMISSWLTSQILPKGLSDQEKLIMPTYQFPVTKGTTPPAFIPRAMAEWEEIDALLITWAGYEDVLAQIVDAAQEECKVLIACDDSTTVKTYLNSHSVPLTNVKFVETGFNSVWVRDYGAHTIYQNYTENHSLVDWTYNRPRPQDDAMPQVHATYFGLPLYQMTSSPNDLVATGGNFMVDGMGTAMSSELILNENTSHTEAQIDTIAKKYLGISRYVFFPTLPYDGIHHIDMHMKLLDEQTILVGEYPSGIADGPQIESNLQYLLNNYNTSFGTPYKVIRIPMPKDINNNAWPNNYGDYCTYTNGVFVNKTYIYPSYYTQYDTTAYRILSEALPGYTLVPIDCYPDPISASGAIHCITNCIGASDPLLINHQSLSDTYNTGDYQVTATIHHSSGIQSATVYYKTALAQNYQSVPMTNTGNNVWSASIPGQVYGSTVYYYIHAQANSGKQQNRPMPAPEGYFSFKVFGSVAINDHQSFFAGDIYPNPASAITVIPLNFSSETKCRISLCDVQAREVSELFNGTMSRGIQNVFFDASTLTQGLYFVKINAEGTTVMKKMVVK